VDGGADALRALQAPDGGSTAGAPEGAGPALSLLETSDASAPVLAASSARDVATDRAAAVTVGGEHSHLPVQSESAAPARGPSWAIHHGDCFELLRGFADDSISVAILDPPYSERQHKGVRSSKRNRLLDGNGRMSKAATSRVVDLGFEHWTRREIVNITHILRRIVRRWVIAFCDDDLLPIWRACAKKAGFTAIKTNVWRRVGGAPQFTGDRPASDVEYIVSMHRPGKKRWNGGGHGISMEYVDDPRDYPDDQPGAWLEYPIVANRSGHRDDRLGTTPKNLELMMNLVGWFSEEGETVLDCTCGPGTTGVAALRLGRSFIGCELLPDRAEMARARLAAEDRGLSLQAVRKGQLGIFDAMGK
jgi:site-specific DNA-methyltransferase (adenine-specific)